MLSKILVPVEFSVRCEGAARYAEVLAAHFDAEMTLAHVVMPAVAYGSPEALAYSTAGDLVAERVKLAEAHLQTFLTDVLEDVRIDRVVLQGDPAHQIVDYAARRGCDLIVMPTHGYGPFRRFLLGSVTAKVLHDASCPVWTGPHLEKSPVCQAISVQKIVCAIDFSNNSRCVLECGAAFARSFDAELAVAHAIPASNLEVGGFYFDPEWRAQMAENAGKRVKELLEQSGIEAQTTVEVGDVAQAISDAARRMNADLLVIGRGHRTGVLGRLRANAYGIIREAPCPVLAI